MNTVQLRNFDLNLLVVFDAVFRELTLAAASVRLSLSQSAISHALGRLRRRVGDELFVREANGMRPTPKALELARPIQRALARIQAALAGEELDPQRSTRTFVVTASDYGCSIVIPLLVARLASAAPSVDLVVAPLNREDVIGQLDECAVDIAIGWWAAVPERSGRSKLMTEELLLVVRKNHPLASGELNADRALGYDHVVVNYVGSDEGLVADFCRKEEFCAECTWRSPRSRRRSGWAATCESQFGYRISRASPTSCSVPSWWRACRDDWRRDSPATTRSSRGHRRSRRAL
jgi:DNA-binding transcriptional LysR family regulator